MTPDLGIDFAVFLAGIWLSTKSMLEASGFVNELRDCVVIGKKSGERLSPAHRRTLRTDWLLSMAGAVLFPLMYAGFLVLIAVNITLDPEPGTGTPEWLRPILIGVALIPAIGSLLFLACGFGDWRLMRDALKERVRGG